MKSIILLCVLLLVSNANPINGYKILGIFPTMSPSHYITGGALMKGLAANGHEVTVISPFPQKKPLQNFRDITTNGLLELMHAFVGDPLDMAKKSPVQMSFELLDMCTMITNFTLRHPSVQQLIHDQSEQFDVIIVEMFLTDALLGFGHRFNAPLIGYSTFGASKWTTDLVGTPSPLSYVPHPSLSFTDKMTFIQRIANTLITALDEVIQRLNLPTQEKLYEDIFPGKNKPNLNDIRTNVSLVLLNSHFTMNYARPYVPNMIEVGGIHINRNAPKELPRDIKQFIESAKHGVIYFSMGSNIKSSLLPAEIQRGLLNAFSKLKEKVLWKWENEKLAGKPDNMLISKWFPQDDVLAHPNVKLFITHGGLLSSTEAVYHGIPIIGIPVFGDQHLNMARAVNNGYAVNIAYSNLTETSITWALNEMLANKKYSDRAKVVSARYRDQPMKPLETAIYWVEYVAKHKGAPHMHSAGQDMSWISYHNVDVYAILLLAVFTLLYILIKTVCSIVSRVSGRTKIHDRNKKQI